MYPSHTPRTRGKAPKLKLKGIDGREPPELKKKKKKKKFKVHSLDHTWAAGGGWEASKPGSRSLVLCEKDSEIFLSPLTEQQASRAVSTRWTGGLGWPALACLWTAAGLSERE